MAASSYEKFRDQRCDVQGGIPLEQVGDGAASAGQNFRQHEFVNLDQINPPPVVAQPQAFSPNVLDPVSRQKYDELRTKHMSSAALLESMQRGGNHLNASVNGQFVSLKGCMSYSNLLAGLLYKGENLVKYNQFNFLQYSHLVIADENNVNSSQRPGGVCLLTDRRLLFLSSQINQSTSLTEWGNTKKLPGGYTLASSLGDTTSYLPIPLRFLRSVEMSGQSGVKGEVIINAQEPCCCGLCGFCGLCCSTPEMLKQWPTGVVSMSQHNNMTITLGVLMPPWERRMFLHIHASPDVPTSVTRDFIALLQQHTPALN